MCYRCQSLEHELSNRNTQHHVLMETIRVLLHANLQGVTVEAEYANQVHMMLRQYEQQIELSEES